jgi:hypothetical protein
MAAHGHFLGSSSYHLSHMVKKYAFVGTLRHRWWIPLIHMICSLATCKSQEPYVLLHCTVMPSPATGKHWHGNNGNDLVGLCIAFRWAIVRFSFFDL